jgi:hypothetical protein
VADAACDYGAKNIVLERSEGLSIFKERAEKTAGPISS